LASSEKQLCFDDMINDCDTCESSPDVLKAISKMDNKQDNIMKGSFSDESD